MVVVVVNLRPNSINWFALSCFLELRNPVLTRLWPGLDVLGPTQYVDLPAVGTAVVVRFWCVAVPGFIAIFVSVSNLMAHRALVRFVCAELYVV